LDASLVALDPKLPSSKGEDRDLAAMSAYEDVDLCVRGRCGEPLQARMVLGCEMLLRREGKN
jgi:hypothetical protein